MVKERADEIKRKTRMLLKKMLTIDLSKSSHNPGSIHLAYAPSAYSLNKIFRVQELSRVTAQNKNFLKRLQKTQSCYNVIKWEHANREKNYRVTQICKNNANFKRIKSPLITTLKRPQSLELVENKRAKPRA